MVIDLVNQPCFFVRAIVGLAIGWAVMIGREVAAGLSGFFLW